jgi:peptidoglycan/LPS O-acetylase OafA/YrhL
VLPVERFRHASRLVPWRVLPPTMADPAVQLSPATPAPSRRVRELDVLRGVAILLVLGHHAGITPTGLPALVQDGLDRWAMAGWVGVDLFFVLSGFLVSGLLFNEYRATGHVRVGRFLLRRGFKIYPAFYVLIASTVVVDYALRRPAGWSPLLHEIFFVQNYGDGLWTHTWSLAVEEHFYLLLALLVAVLVATAAPRRTSADPFRIVGPLFLAVAVAALLARVITERLAPSRLSLHLAPTHLRLDSLMCGVALSYLFHFHRDWLAARVRAHRPVMILASLLCLAPALFLPVTSPVMQTIGFTLLYIGFGSVLLLAIHRPPVTSPTLAPRAFSRVLAAVATALAWLGTYSYSIYLWHMPAQAWSTIGLARLTGHVPSPTPAWFLYNLEAIGIGVVMSRLIERPALAVRERVMAAAASGPITRHGSRRIGVRVTPASPAPSESP